MPFLMDALLDAGVVALRAFAVNPALTSATVPEVEFGGSVAPLAADALLLPVVGLGRAGNSRRRA